MSDLYKYFMDCPQFVITFLFFFAAGAISFASHIIKNKNDFSIVEMFKHCVPFDVLRSKSFHMDVKMNIIHSLTDFVFFIPGMAVMAITANFVDQSLANIFQNYPAAHPSYPTAFFCTVIILLSVEFSGYVIHYAEHKIPILWELHKVHHSADFMNPLTARRAHSIPLLYSGIATGVIVGATAGILIFLFKISLIEAMALRAFSSKMASLWTLSPLKHSHIPVGLGWFDKIFISPHMHQVHHSKLEHHWDKNFGVNLSIFDWLFKTGYKPARGEKIVLGISGYDEAEIQKFNTLIGAYITPLAKIGERIRKAIGAGERTMANALRDNETNSGPAACGENSEFTPAGQRGMENPA